MPKIIARRYVVRGQVQGVGFRYFVQQAAVKLDLAGTVRNQSDGTVEVIAQGTSAQVSEFAGTLRTGPPGASVRGVEVSEAAVQQYHSFVIAQ
ncbi:MAG: acylphosphatase [Acidobacteriota bacterium]|nr:acylphosphatase [Acidobacteriota bacterium]